MNSLGRLIAGVATAAGLLGLTNVGLANEELVVLTSFPPSFYEVFVERFVQSHPEIEIKVIQRSTASGVHFLLERPHVDVDLFWVSSPDAFELLKSEGQLQKVPFDNPTSQSAIAGHPVHDPEGYYYGFAFSTFGVAYNSHYLAAHGLEVPRQWQDLAAPAYAGHLGITSPARSGTTHFVVEAILQTFGWDQGWAMLSRIGGNLSTITARSFGVLDGIEQARFGLGPTIDFLAFTGGPTPDTISYRALEPLFLAPASIAALQRSQNREAAVTFINFLMSREGQRLLMDPEIGRIPVDDDLRSTALAQQGLVLAEAKADDGLVFDAALSARRYELVNIIFDEWVVANRQALSDNWQRLNPNMQEHAPALALLSAPPVTEARAEIIMASGIMRGASGDSLMSEAQQDVLAEIRSALQTNIAAAEAILNTKPAVQVERN